MIAVVWLGFSWKWGVRVYYLMVADLLINNGIKWIFMEPRPFAVHPGLNLVPVNDPWSFPSGGADAAMLYGGLLIWNFKNSWVRILGCAYILIVGFSRVYLGAHYPTDVLAGWVSGLLVLTLFLWIYPHVEKALKKVPFGWAIAAVVLIALVSLFFHENTRISRVLSSSVGIAAGLAIAFSFPTMLLNPKKFWERVGRSIVGIAGCIFFLYLAIHTMFIQPSFLSMFIPSFFLGIWLPLLAALPRVHTGSD
jgi:hypothetical protein